MTVLTVGTNGEYATISAAVNAAGNGDTIDVHAGTYTNDFINTTKSLTLQAVGGVVKMTETRSPPDGKAMITEGTPGGNFTINGFEIYGVSVGAGNGAAVRYQGGKLTLNNDSFHNNQEGLLTTGDPNGSITINHSDIGFNGTGSGQAHDVYVGGVVGTLTVENSYIHDALGGHLIKSRADNTIIENNRLFDNNSHTSYEIDVPQGGNLVVSGNVIQQGPNSANPNIIAYGEEGRALFFNPGSTFDITGNTFVNQASNGYVVWNDDPSVTAHLTSNRFYGLMANRIVNGAGVDVAGNTVLASLPALDRSASWALNILGGSATTPTPTPTPPAGGTGGGAGSAPGAAPGTAGAFPLTGQGSSAIGAGTSPLAFIGASGSVGQSDPASGSAATSVPSPGAGAALTQGDWTAGQASSVQYAPDSGSALSSDVYAAPAPGSGALAAAGTTQSPQPGVIAQIVPGS